MFAIFKNVVDNNILNLEKSRDESLLVLVVDKKGSFEYNENYENFYVSTHSKRLEQKNTVHGFLISANCLFTSGNIVEEVPYDPFLFFSGEEHSLALRLYTHGYNIFHTYQVPVYHCYVREYRSTFWGDGNIDETREKRWWEYDFYSKKRLADICSGKIGTYGLGAERTLHSYIKISGIDYFSRVIHSKAETGENIFTIPYTDKLEV